MGYCYSYIAEGAKCISEMLKVNSILESPCLMSNNIGDYGTTAIAGAISTTSIKNCLFTTVGLHLLEQKMLAESLILYQSIRLLCGKKIPITMEGALLIF